MKWLSLHIGGQRWGVHLVKGNAKSLGGAPEENVAGLTDPERCRIFIAKELDDQAREDTLVHELLHATLYVSGATNALRDACEGPDIADRVEEQMVQCMTPVWHRLLKDLGFVFPR